ncbi:hypothetical protein PLESTB_000827700 [Pleodorina starrii]|uniref:FAD-binding PCMH-type domain-containing protein n=1 Tax=Pleodorina starrii TaxID=330485 RepID=A0A9W6F366_9CHLO|nr:hypothetical protein PLESTB_000827700 [Pleodorina starrii]GLC64561.1 hypothetical protein PLESTF_000178900 [Pleodorina starrii]
MGLLTGRRASGRQCGTGAAANGRRRPARAALALVAAVLTAVGTGALLLLLGVAGPPAVNGYVPWDLSNFQNEYVCDNSSVRIVRPRTVEDVQAAVKLHSSVMAVGGGWSWNQPFFCASNGTAAPTPDGFRGVAQPPGSSASPAAAGPANIVMQTLRPLLIQVNETEESVTVDAGVRTIDLLRYLAAYVTPSSPTGWTLPAFPWFVFQTLGGAVATNTHGSSLQHSSLSSQVLALTLVLANGTVRTFTPETDPFFFRAVQVGVGKLGIITHIKFRIVREMPVTRTIHRIAASEFLGLMREGQTQWNTNGTLPEWMDETEWFWVPQRHEFLMVTFTRGDSPDASKRLAVLSAFARSPPEATTAYNTSLELLERAADLRNGNVTIDVWPLLSNVTFDPATNISNVALPVLRRLNDTVLNVPWQQSPGAGAGAGAAAEIKNATVSNGGSAAANGNTTVSDGGSATVAPPVAAMQGPPASGSLAALAAAVARGRQPKAPAPAAANATTAEAATTNAAATAANAAAEASNATATNLTATATNATATAADTPAAAANATAAATNATAEAANATAAVDATAAAATPNTTVTADVGATAANVTANTTAAQPPAAAAAAETPEAPVAPTLAESNFSRFVSMFRAHNKDGAAAGGGGGGGSGGSGGSRVVVGSTVAIDGGDGGQKAVVAVNGTVAATTEADAAGEAVEGAAWNVPEKRPATVFYGLVNMADAYIDISRSGVYSIAANATKEAQSSYLYQPESILEVNVRKVMYDQYEVTMPVSSMADCWQGLLELLYGADNVDGTAYNGTASPESIVTRLMREGNGTALKGPDGRPDYGFRSNPLVRLTGAETGLLSPSGGVPHMWLNIEDYLYYNRPVRRTNVVFKALVGYLRSDPRCGNTGLSGSGARMHWGKAGWPDAGCWHGDKEYPDTWCDFGCAVRQLDPNGKFQDSAPDRWNWDGVPLDSCCVADVGFKRAAEDPACVCKVAHKRSAEDCPPPPYYTYR